MGQSNFNRVLSVCVSVRLIVSLPLLDRLTAVIFLVL